MGGEGARAGLLVVVGAAIAFLLLLLVLFYSFLVRPRLEVLMFKDAVRRTWRARLSRLGNILPQRPPRRRQLRVLSRYRIPAWPFVDGG